MNQAKIYDIAGAAGVSLATVSRVLNHPEKVKEATREKVMKIIKDKGYKPNANARGLASRRSTTVAIVVPPISRSSVAEMIQGISDSASEYGYTLRLFINNDVEMQSELWSDIIASSVDGVLFMNDEVTPEIYNLIKYSPVPIVFVNSLSQTNDFGSVCIDYEDCAYNITKQMIDRGNKKIMFINTEHKYVTSDLKQKGYEKAMNEAGLQPNVVMSSGKIEINEPQFISLLKDGCPEVVLASRDSIGISFMNVAVKKGYNVPRDLQVIGFQNTRYAKLSNPKLTCVETPIYEIGSKAMSYLTELMKEDEEIENNVKNVVVDYSIIWRETTK